MNKLLAVAVVSVASCMQAIPAHALPAASAVASSRSQEPLASTRACPSPQYPAPISPAALTADRSSRPSTTATTSAIRAKDGLSDRIRNQQEATLASEHASHANLRKAMKRFDDLLRSARKSNDSTRLPLLERKMLILKERLGLLDQISRFRKEGWLAQSRKDLDGQRETAQKISVARDLIHSRQAEENALMKKLEALDHR